MIWIAGGHRRGITADIVFLYACRADDVNLLKELEKLAPNIKSIRGIVYQRTGGLERIEESVPGAWMVKGRRMDAKDISAFEDVREREAFVCGPARRSHC